MPAQDEHNGAHGSPHTITDRLYRWCTAPDSVSALLAADPSLAPGEAFAKIYGHHARKTSVDIRDIGKGAVAQDELQRAEHCGKWGSHKPDDLFLRVYHDALCTLEHNPAHGMASPSLMGSSGTMPLTIISVIPDIVRHMSNLIVRAEKEVFLATNFWQNSVASKYITNAMKELSRRAGERGTKIVMKVMYDRGSAKQLLEPHTIVPEKEYTGKAVNLPAKHEIPNIDLEVMNFHDPVVGTFHAKYMVVDRRIGVVQSNNIQDNCNMEMMVQVEGAIVDSLYDMALLSWHKKMDPPLPCLNSPAASATADGGVGSFGASHARIFTSEGTLNGHSAVIDPSKMAQRQAYGTEADGKPRPKRDSGLGADAVGPSTIENTLHPVNGDSMDHRTQDRQHDCVADHCGYHGSSSSNAQATAEYLGDNGSQAIPEPQIANPSPAGRLLPEHTSGDPHYDVDIAGEVARVQTSVSAHPDETQMQAVERHLNHTTNKGFHSGHPASDCDPADEMTPYVPHPTHDAFPIALVNRPPYGPPNHRAVSNPQNATWLSGLRNARKNVFIQTPTLNAEPLVPAIAEACERGIDVHCYVCLGYNDTGELLPKQGGHNEMIANKLYKQLSPAARSRLHWSWYVAKDQTRPIVAKQSRRSCHIKLMIVDEHVGVVGSGNQDTQSWFHSQEVNILLQSADVCRSWIDGLRRNQNTHLFGAVGGEDGVWRDEEGKEVDGAMGVDPGRFAWTKGFVGAIKRVQGTGDF
ncbi:Uu.00g054490.m01.CDS01 [Anthostomella pinea]|uniref:Uu.00g054490.m01.CDS01 n=1 Tax=Anthostomella pinea TaxID=933095 RepID=A0AAI8VXC2_9PEZI|nr:Uu.00g054490.m01.CDS01 [Anthostomella pinea]